MHTYIYLTSIIPISMLQGHEDEDDDDNDDGLQCIV